MSKQLVFFSFFFVFFFASVNAATPFYLLDMSSSSSIPSKPFPRDEVSLIVNIKNISSTSTAFDVNASIQLNPSIFESLDVFESFETLKSDSTKQVGFRFKIKDDAFPGAYLIPLTLDYSNGSAIVSDSFDLNFVVNECFGLDVSNISYLPKKVYAGEEIVVSASVENACSGVARDVSIELKPVTNSTFDPFILLSSNLLKLGNIFIGGEKSVSFVLEPSSNATPQIYVFELSAKCLDCNFTTDKVSFEVLGKPQVIVSGTDVSIDARPDAKNLLQGDVFSFSVQVDNIGKETAKAVEVVLQVDEGVVGSNRAFVGNVDEDDSGAAIFDLTILPSAKTGEHPAQIVIEFIDETGERASVVQDYSFFVNERAAESPIFLIIVLIVLFVVAYFVLKLVFRELALRKARLQ